MSMEARTKGLSMERCGANTIRGAICGKPAGWGTPYRHGRCKLHGGASSTHLKAAQQREADRAVELFGLPREVEPHEALLEEAWQRPATSSGWAAWSAASNQISWCTASPRRFSSGTAPAPSRHALLSMGGSSSTRRSATSSSGWRAAIDTGVAERQVRLAEEQAQRLAHVIRAILTDLGHDLADENFPTAVWRQLIEGGTRGRASCTSTTGEGPRRRAAGAGRLRRPQRQRGTLMLATPGRYQATTSAARGCLRRFFRQNRSDIRAYRLRKDTGCRGSVLRS